MRTLFVSATDTGVGKTAVSAGLVRLFSQVGPVRYWKPVQSGAEADDDTETVVALCRAPQARFAASVYRLKLPLSPHLAARKEGVRIEVAKLMETARRLQTEAEEGSGLLIAEGAGGLLVPLTEDTLQIDWIQSLGWPVLLVVENRLGAINHSLLSIEACRSRGIPVAGVVLNLSGDLAGNAESIETYGKVPVLAEYPRYADVQSLVARIAGDRELAASLRGAGVFRN